MAMNLKYVEILVAAKMSVKFRSSIREIPKNRSKFTNNDILHLFFLPVQPASALFSFWLGFVGNT